jgi:hypothetical protein
MSVGGRAVCRVGGCYRELPLSGLYRARVLSYLTSTLKVSKHSPTDCMQASRHRVLPRQNSPSGVLTGLTALGRGVHGPFVYTPVGAVSGGKNATGPACRSRRGLLEERLMSRGELRLVDAR